MGVKNAQRLIEARFRKPAKQLVHELYYAKGMTQAQVAKELGVSHMTVHNWMREWKWPTRKFTVVEVPPLEAQP